MTDEQSLRLWEYEKQLIDILQKLDIEKTIKYGQKNKFDVEGFGSNVQKRHTREQNSSSIFLNHNNNTTRQTSHSRPQNNRFQGGSLLERINYLDSLSNQGEKTEKKILTFEENSVELDEILNMLQRGTEPSQFPSPAVHNKKDESDLIESSLEIEQQAFFLSNKIKELRQELRLCWLCDTITVYDINLKMGGDGYFIAENGEKERMPADPLGDNCPHRKGSAILRCVVCPANYSENPERFHRWLDYIELKQKQNKKPGAE